jgi:hypothetical protein
MGEEKWYQRSRGPAWMRAIDRRLKPAQAYVKVVPPIRRLGALLVGVGVGAWLALGKHGPYRPVARWIHDPRSLGPEWVCLLCGLLLIMPVVVLDAWLIHRRQRGGPVPEARAKR